MPRAQAGRFQWCTSPAQMFDEADLDGDGTLDEDEFVALLAETMAA